MSSSAADKKSATQLLEMLAAKGGQNRIVPSDFLELVVKRIGGPDELAKVVADILTDTKVTNVAKQRTMSDIMHLMQHVETKSARPADLSSLPTEDLRTLLRESLTELDGYGVKTETDQSDSGQPGRHPDSVFGAEEDAPPPDR